MISDSDVCWQLLALIVGVNHISCGWLILNSYISAGYCNYCAVMDYAADYLILVDCITVAIVSIMVNDDGYGSF